MEMGFKQFLVEEKLNENRLSDDDVSTISYLIHDKGHITDGGKVSAIENALKLHSEKITKKLYRGVGPKELDIIKAGTNFNQYQSFSEDINTAKGFGKNVITILPNDKNAFCLWKWGLKGLEALKKENPNEYEASDGDYLIDSYKEELEWILPFDTKFEMVDEDKLIFKIK